MMGYSTVPISMFHPDMKQTPENVRKVLDIAGWTSYEAAAEIDIDPGVLRDALMSTNEWRKLLDKAGRRSFDHGCGE